MIEIKITGHSAWDAMEEIKRLARNLNVGPESISNPEITLAGDHTRADDQVGEKALDAKPKASPKKKSVAKAEVADPVEEAAGEKAPEPVLEEAPAPAAVEPSSLKGELRGALTQAIVMEKEVDAKAIFEKYGASKLSDIKEEDYVAVIADLKAV